MSENISEALSKSDLKKIGGGGLGVLAVLFLFQDRGLSLMSDKQTARDEVVIEKTIANSERINRLEKSVTNLNAKLDMGFDSIRNQIRDDTGKLSDILRDATNDRFTKTEHMSYRTTTREELQRIDDALDTLREKLAKRNGQ